MDAQRRGLRWLRGRRSLSKCGCLLNPISDCKRSTVSLLLVFVTSLLLLFRYFSCLYYVSSFCMCLCFVASRLCAHSRASLLRFWCRETIARSAMGVVATASSTYCTGCRSVFNCEPVPKMTFDSDFSGLHHCKLCYCERRGSAAPVVAVRHTKFPTFMIGMRFLATQQTRRVR